MVVSLTTTTLVAGVPPIVTAVAPVNPTPVIVTGVPPETPPFAGLIALTVGGVVGAETNCSMFNRNESSFTAPPLGVLSAKSESYTTASAPVVAFARLVVCQASECPTGKAW